MPISFIIVHTGPFLIPPRESLLLGVAVVFFKSSECAGVSILAFGLVALEDGGCTALEGSGGGRCEGAIGVIVKEEGDEGP